MDNYSCKVHVFKVHDQRRRAALQVFGDPPNLHRNERCAQKNNNNSYEMEEEKI